MQEVKREQPVFVCPECGKPFEKVSTAESHRDGTYEVNLKASHIKPH